jgi:hypothetical protein
MRRPLSLSAAAAGLIAVGSCGRPAPPDTSLVGLSFAGARPFGDIRPPRFRLGELLENVPASQADQLTPDPSRWTGVGADLRFEKTAVLVMPTNDDPQVRIDARFKADSVCSIEVVFLGAVWGGIEIFWALDDGDGAYSAERRVTWTPVAGAGALNRVATFDVRRHSGWRGAIRSLRVDPLARGASSIASVRLVRCAPAALDRVRAASRRVWETATETTLRSAILVTEGVRHEWRTEAEPHSRLVFASARVNGDTSFRVEVRIAGRAAPFLIRVIRPGLHWREESLDLPLESASPVTISWRGSGSAEPAFVSEPRIESGAPSGRPDVILVSLDTAAPRRFSLYGHSKKTTPRLDRRAQLGRIYTHAYGAGAYTTPSHAGMLSGISPLLQGAVLGPPPANEPTLAGAFRSGGYRTLAVASGMLVGINSGFSGGFDYFESRPMPMNSAVDRAIELLDATREPVFLFFHTYEAHTPYRRSGEISREEEGCGPIGSQIAPSLKKRGIDAGIPFVTWMPPDRGSRSAEECVPTLYDDGLARMDQSLDRLLSAVWTRGRGVPPIVAVTADHGELLGEGGLFLHGWDDELVARVPLILWGASIRPGESPDLACGVDIAPTLLSLAKIDVYRTSGRDLNGSTPQKPCFTFSTFPTPILTARSAHARASFDLTTGRIDAPPAANRLVTALRGEVARAFTERYVEVVSGSASFEVDLRTDGLLACLSPPCESTDRGRTVTARAVRNQPVRLGIVPGLGRYLSIGWRGKRVSLSLDGDLMDVEAGREGLRLVRTLSPGRSGVKVRWRGQLPAGFDASEAAENLKALGYLH